MEFRVLGPVEVRDGVGSGGSLLAGPSQRALIAVLLAHAGRHVRADTLADALWPDGPPRTATATLRSHVSRLRRHLGDRLVTEDDGYRLDVAPGELDADRFGAALDRARAGDAGGLPAVLDLWRGDAFGGCADLGPVVGRARALDLARTDARVLLARSLVDAGRAVAVSEELVAEQPLHEPGWVVLLDALVAAGRAADASVAYRRARAALREAGLEPSAALRAAHAAALSPPGTANRSLGPVPGSAGAVRRTGLRAPGLIERLIGRHDDLAAVAALLADGPLVTLVGPGGVGKTRLALAAAAADPRPSRVVELAAVADPEAVPDVLLAALGLTVDGGPARAVLPRVRELGAVVVLDNCEHVIDAVADAVTRILGTGAAARVRILATSRERLGVAGERCHPVGPLAESAAVELFRVRAEASRPGAVDDLGAVRQIVALLEGLPLAIEMAAARTASLAPADLARRIAAELEARSDPAGRGRRGEPRHRTLRAVIAWSEQLLEPVERQALSDCSVFAGAVSADDAVAVLDVGPDVVETLAARSLLELDGARYRMLRTVRAVVPGPGPDVARRHAEHVAAVAAQEDARLRTGAEAAAHARLAGLLDEARSAHAWARRHDPGLAARLTRSLHVFGVSRLHDEILSWAGRFEGGTASAAYRWVMSGDLGSARRRAEAVLARPGDPVDVLHALETLADVATFEGRLDDGVRLADELRDRAVLLDDPHYALFGHGTAVICCAYAGRTAEADRRLAVAEAACTGLSPSDAGWLAYFRGEAWLERDPAAAAPALDRAVALADSVGNRYLGGVARVSATSSRARSGGDPSEALALFAGVLRHWLDTGSRTHLLTTLRNLVDVLARDDAGSPEVAAELWGAVSRPELTPSFGSERVRLEAARVVLSRRVRGFDRVAVRGAVRGLDDAARAWLTDYWSR